MRVPLRQVRASFAFLAVGLAMVATSVTVDTAVAQAPGLTKIVPSSARPGHPFTIIDVPQHRLSTGAVVLFRRDGAETQINLRTHRPHNTAKGRLGRNMVPGHYTVHVRVLRYEFDVGSFTVIGQHRGESYGDDDTSGGDDTSAGDDTSGEGDDPTVPIDAIIDPTEGVAGITFFTMNDPAGRMQDGDLILFYQESNDPLSGAPAMGTVLVDASLMLGIVPNVPAGQYLVTVRSPSNEARFADIAFVVTSVW